MTEPNISIVVAVSANGVIGRDGGLPWHLPSDLKRFKALTLGKPVIMGRKTWGLDRTAASGAPQYRHQPRRGFCSGGCHCSPVAGSGACPKRADVRLISASMRSA